jgi:hypothetical protein
VNSYDTLYSSDRFNRPTAEEALLHPFFWSPEKRLAFLRDASDRVELEDREEGSALLAAMEGVGQSGNIGLWDAQLDKALLENLGKYRRYNSRSIRDLLRVIRNKCNHYRELPQSVKVRGTWGRRLLGGGVVAERAPLLGCLEALDRDTREELVVLVGGGLLLGRFLS